MSKSSFNGGRTRINITKKAKLNEVDLLKAFDSYQDFERKAYFTLVFNTLASELLLEVPMKPSKENMEASIELIGLKAPEFVTLFKNWNTEDSSNADFSKDFPHRILFQSSSSSRLIWVSLAGETLFVEFLYDCNDSKSEKWVIDANHKPVSYTHLTLPTIYSV